jgi:hypothetical protein
MVAVVEVYFKINHKKLLHLGLKQICYVYSVCLPAIIVQDGLVWPELTPPPPRQDDSPAGGAAATPSLPGLQTAGGRVPAGGGRRPQPEQPVGGLGHGPPLCGRHERAVSAGPLPPTPASGRNRYTRGTETSGA